MDPGPAAFWTTRVSAINQVYFVLLLFLSGQIAPLTLFPNWLQIVANVLPFRWMLGFPVALVLGQLTPVQALEGLASQAVWAIGQPGADPPGLAGGGTRLFGGGCMNTLRLLVVFFRVSVLNETAYRVNFFLQLFQSLLELGTALAGLAVIFSFTTALGGWGRTKCWRWWGFIS